MWNTKLRVSAIDKDSIDEWWLLTNFPKIDKHRQIGFATRLNGLVPCWITSRTLSLDLGTGS